MQMTDGSLEDLLPADWRALVGQECREPYFQQLERFLQEERRTQTVYPPRDEVFSALTLTPFDDVRVLVVGQDPYHDEGQAHGLAFSVRPGVKPPPSLRNMLKELRDDMGCRIPNNGYLVPWAAQGVLLLNTVLTVRAHQANSHKGKGWEQWTDAIIRQVGEKQQRVVFVLWGANAQKKVPLITGTRHTIVQAAHPSPLSAHQGFFGSRPYSTINRALSDVGSPEIDWQLPDV